MVGSVNHGCLQFWLDLLPLASFIPGKFKETRPLSGWNSLKKFSCRYTHSLPQASCVGPSWSVSSLPWTLLNVKPGVPLTSKPHSSLSNWHWMVGGYSVGDGPVGPPPAGSVSQRSSPRLKLGASRCLLYCLILYLKSSTANQALISPGLVASMRTFQPVYVPSAPSSPRTSTCPCNRKVERKNFLICLLPLSTPLWTFLETITSYQLLHQ